MMLRLPDKQKQKCFMIWAAQLVVFLKGNTDIIISIQIVLNKYFAIKKYCLYTYYFDSISFIFSVCYCLKMKELEGPDLTNSGEIVTFTCRYDLGKDAIYSIKWYKEDNELYRYIPTDSPEYRIFHGTPGVIVMV